MAGTRGLGQAEPVEQRCRVSPREVGWTAVSGQSFTGYGLNWLAAFAKAHNKEADLPEFGLFSTDTSGGGGDDGAYITQIADWIKANGTGPSVFWNFGDGTLPWTS